jgi:hypothetical protein
MKTMSTTLSTVGVVIVMTLVACSSRQEKYQTSPLVDPFPLPDSIHAITFQSIASETEWTAQVQPVQFETLSTMFAGARHDPAPLPWEILGTLEVKLKSGSSVRIDVFNTIEPPAAFKIGEIYYRSSTSQQFTEFFRNDNFQQAPGTVADKPRSSG